MQVLCYTCRTWFHQKCLTCVPELEAQKKMQERWVVSSSESASRLVLSAMGSMRRGHPHTVEGDYSKVYQAQSILTALMKGDRKRYDFWIQKHGSDMMESVSDLHPIHEWFLCPKCNHVI